MYFGEEKKGNTTIKRNDRTFKKLISKRFLFIYVLNRIDRRDGGVVRASASQSVDLGFIPLVESYLKTLKNGIYSFPAWRWAFRGGCREQAGKFACCVLGQGTERDAPPLCGGQVTRKWQLPSECEHIVLNIAIHRFLVNGE